MSTDPSTWHPHMYRPPTPDEDSYAGCVLSTITDRRDPSPTEACAYLCTWEGYDVPSWETTEHLASLGFLSAVKHYEATALPASQEPPQEPTLVACLERSNAVLEPVATIDELLLGREFPRALPIPGTASHASPPGELKAHRTSYTSAERTELLESYLRTSNEPLPEGMESLARGRFCFSSWNDQCTAASHQSPLPPGPAVFRAPAERVPFHGILQTVTTFAAIHSTAAYGHGSHSKAGTALSTVATRKLQGMLVEAADPTSTGVAPHHFVALASALDPSEARALPPPALVGGWAATPNCTQAELWFPDGVRYRGSVVDGRPWGYGEMVLPKDAGMVRGSWLNDRTLHAEIELASGVVVRCCACPTKHVLVVTAPSSLSFGLEAAAFPVLLPPPYIPGSIVSSTVWTKASAGSACRRIKHRPNAVILLSDILDAMGSVAALSEDALRDLLGTGVAAMRWRELLNFEECRPDIPTLANTPSNDGPLHKK